MNKIVDRAEWLLELGGVKKDVAFLLIGAASLIISIFDLLPLPFDAAWAAIIFCGIPIIIEAVIGLVTAFDIKADVLVSMALIASVCIGEDFAAGEVAFIMQLGALLEDLTVARARAGIEKLVHLTPQTARVISRAEAASGPAGEAETEGPAGAEKETIIPAEEVRIGDILRVLPGETVPVDGVLVRGQTSINQAVMTGESLPVDKEAGDEVFSGTVNQFGAFEMRATKVGEDSSIQRMIRLVQSADAGKAKIVTLADRWATWIVVGALSAATLTWLITGEIIRAVTILVVFCPCALVLATPTAIMAAIGNATRHGFLVREGDALERLAKVSRITFDKTGTLTYGQPQVTEVGVIEGSFSREELYALAAAAERLSEHPLGRAIVRCYREESGVQPPAAVDFQMMPGQGVTALVDGRRVRAGNLRLLGRQSAESKDAKACGAADAHKDAKACGAAAHKDAKACVAAHKKNGSTVIYVEVDGKLAGYIALADTLREESPRIMAELEELKVTPVLLTGDHEEAARSIARQLGIKDVAADCMPEDKLKYIGALQQRGEDVCMIGDGINDAPALKKANVGIAMGKVGSDIAVDAADIVLVDDEIRELPHLLALARRMMTTIKLNLTFSMTLNFIAIILAMTGLMGPVVGALVHNAGSVLVILNSALLLKSSR